MSKLLRFEFKRALRNHMSLYMCVISVLIGLLGFGVSILLTKDDFSAKVGIVGLYNAYSQFSYLILGVFFVFVFTKDFQFGHYQYIKQLGFELKHQFIAKILVILASTMPVMVLVYCVFGLILGIDDFLMLFQILAINLLSMLFIVLWALLVSLIFKRTITSTLVLYSAFLVFDIINYLGYGLTNPADSNSFSTFVVSQIADLAPSHLMLAELKIDYSEYGFLLAIIVECAWIAILLIASIIRIRLFQNNKISLYSSKS